MAWLRTEEEVEEMIAEMMKKGNGKYITQSVLFKKDSPVQMELLKKSLMSSTSFGAFIKQVLSEKFSEDRYHERIIVSKQQEIIPNRNPDNFL